MSPIRLLPPALSARIAAGEVVERPASVAKELVENALDAGATRIAVEIAGGGLELIRVADNGRGIAHSDTKLLFQRHATSKLDPASNLSGIATLGFRGEALYSLVSVADVNILTRSAGEVTGTWVEVELTGGEAKVTREQRGAPQGTTVTVRRLFSRVPARRKFMRSQQAEAARVQSVLCLYVLSYPEVAFALVHEGRERLSSTGTGDLREAVAAVYGEEAASAMLALESPGASGGQTGVSINGLISPPAMSRANRNAISIFVNRRPVQSRSLVAALEQAYQGFLTQGRHPLVVLNVLTPYEDVDVNVHPAKAEVRFRDEGALFTLVQRAVRSVLTALSPVPPMFDSQRHAEVPPRSADPFTVGPDAVGVVRGEAPVSPGTVDTREADAGGAVGQGGSVRGERPAPKPGAPEPPREPDRVVAHGALPLLRVLGQSQNTYIVAEGPQGVYLVDQHAAHERVQYERLCNNAARHAPDVQALLSPEAVDLSPHQQETLERLTGVLAEYGWLLEAFGGQTILVRAMPSLLASRGVARSLMDLLDAASAETALPTWEHRIGATMACHGSVRAGQTLSVAEMTELLSSLQACHEPQTCPHGRPTMLHLSSTHLERQFRRR